MSPKTKSGGADTAEAANAMQMINEMQRAGMGSLAWLGTAWIEQMSALGSECLCFLADRVREDVKTQHRILNCRDVSEIQRIQLEFIQKALADYQAETGKIYEMGNEVLARMKARLEAADE